MMNGSKRIISCILLVVLLTLGAVAVAEDIVPYASELIGGRFINAWAYEGGEVKFVAEIVAVDSLEKLGFSSLKLQEKQGSRWVTVKSAYDKYAYDNVRHDYTISYDGTSGNEYRLVVVYYAKDGDITDTRTKTSRTVTAK